MKKVLLSIILIFLFVNNTDAQRWKLKRVEAIVGLGVANAFGDIGGADEVETLGGFKDYKFKDTRPSFCMGVRYRLNEDQSVKFNIYSAMGGGKDQGSRNESRGYSYKTFLFEPSLQYEYYFLSEDRKTRSSALGARRGMINTFSMISIYGFAGIGGVLYVPKFEGNLIVPDKETVKDNAGFSPVVPIGFGAKYVLTSEISLNLEIGRRITFTDYIEGLSTDFSNKNDTYYFGNISVVYKLTTTRRGVPIIFQGGRSSKGSGSAPSRRRKPVGL